MTTYIDQIKTKDGNLYDVKDSILTERVDVLEESIPSKVSELENDADYINTKYSFKESDANSFMLFKGAIGIDMNDTPIKQKRVMPII